MPDRTEYPPPEPGRMRARRLRNLARLQTEAALAARVSFDDPGLRAAYPSLERTPIRLIACPVVKDINQGGLLRVADAFRLEGVDLAPTSREGADLRGGVSAGRWQPHRWIAPLDAVRESRAAGRQVVALTFDADAMPYDRFDWRFPLAIVVGEEVYGMHSEVRALCDASVAIPMYGMVESLNVATGAAIVVATAFRRFLETRPDFAPARNASRRLLGLPDADFPL
ncbi:MAG: hypothetical protein KIS66_17715 [Fimbriimonadaceae bacterium]|nr:hypothetical protein [Fimbriimonadaceae bacterium]